MISPSASRNKPKTTTTEMNNRSRCCQSVGMALKNQPKNEGDVLTRALHQEGGGRETFKGFGYDRPGRSPERIAKAQAFWRHKQEIRKDLARCPRCGGERGIVARTCDRCREKIKKAKLRAKGMSVKHDANGISVEELAGMVIQVREEMDKMQQRFKQWQRSADYRRDRHYRTNAMRRKYFKPVNIAEAMDFLTQTNHAYAEIK